MSSKKTSAFKNEKNFLWSGIALAIVGALVSIYTVFHHIDLKEDGVSDAACNISQTVSCNAIAASEYSEVFGIPLGVWGLGYFLALISMLVIAWKRPKDKSASFFNYAGLVVVGVLTTITLASISAFSIGAICPSCVAVYAICIGQALSLYLFRSVIPRKIESKSIINSLAGALIPLFLALIAYQLIEPETLVQTTTEITNFTGLSKSRQEVPINKSAFSGLGEDYRLGSDNAKVIIVEFSDFQCPSCKRMNHTLKSLRKEYGDQILIVYKNFPLDNKCNPSMPGPMHQLACDMATLARCAGQYGKFWQYHDLVFANHQAASSTSVKDWAREVGLSDEQINNCMSSKGILDKIRDDIALANKLGVNSTPSLYINGYKFVGRGANALKLEVDRLLNR
ncbi:MAG: thioredoxin domain-containing protein [Oligoflexales bacterium]|nr:thioredoxin domain-containing protein [Oligoflexales bacterium]